MKILISSFVLFYFTATLNAQCISNDSNLFSFTYNAHIYTLVKENKNWTDAAACAKSMGGYLAEINSGAEMIKINDAIILGGNIDISKTVAPDGGGASYIWLGGNDSKVEGDWVWNGNNDSIELLFFRGIYPSGLPINGAYVNWGQEPDNYNNSQDGLGLALTDWPLGTARHWNDLNTNNQLYYLMENDNALGLNESTIESQIQLYPNPSNDILYIENTSLNRKFTISFLDLTGNKVITEQMDGMSTQIKLDKVETGLYFVQFTSNENSVILNYKLQIIH